MTIEERLRTEIKNDLIELLGKGYSLDESLVELEDEYCGMINYILNDFTMKQIKENDKMDFEQFFNEAMKQTTEEKRTIKCALILDEDVRFYSLTPSQYALLMYLSDDEVNFYDSRIIPLDEGSFETF